MTEHQKRLRKREKLAEKHADKFSRLRDDHLFVGKQVPPIPDCLVMPKPSPTAKRGFFRTIFGSPFGASQDAGSRMGTEIGLDLLWLANNKAEMKRQVPVLVFGTDNFHSTS